MTSPGYLEFVYLPTFERTAAGVVSDDEMRRVEGELLQDAERGSVQGGTGGVRKIRVATGGGGKRGGARVVYLHVQVRQRIYFILAYPKNVQASLTPEQKRIIRNLVTQLKEE